MFYADRTNLSCDRIFQLTILIYIFFVVCKRIQEREVRHCSSYYGTVFSHCRETFLSLTSRAPAHTNNTKTGAMRKIKQTSHPYTKINFLPSQSTTERANILKNERRVVRDVLHLFGMCRSEYYIYIYIC